MYINNTKKLFNDLYNLPTMRSYMVVCEDDGMENDLSNLISIVECNRNEVHYGGEGSLSWDLEMCEDEKERQQVIQDSRMIDAIWRRIQKELKAKYVIQCESCKYAWFHQRNSKCVKSIRENGRNSSFKCFCKGTLNVYTMEEWLVGEGIYNQVEKYLK